MIRIRKNELVHFCNDGAVDGGLGQCFFRHSKRAFWLQPALLVGSQHVQRRPIVDLPRPHLYHARRIWGRPPAWPRRPIACCFEPDGRTLYVPDGQTLLEAARQAGILLNAPCGGNGTCGGCRIIIPQRPAARPPRSAAGNSRARNWPATSAWRARSASTATSASSFPRRPRLGDQKILTEGAERPVALAPNVRKVAVHLPPPSVADQRADAERLLDGLAEKGLADLAIDVRAARELPERLRALDFHPAVVVIGREVVHLDRAHHRRRLLRHRLRRRHDHAGRIPGGPGHRQDRGRGQPHESAGGLRRRRDRPDRVLRPRRRTARGRSTTSSSAALNEILAEACRKADIRPTAVYEAVGRRQHDDEPPPAAAAGGADRAGPVRGGLGVGPLGARPATWACRLHPRGRVYTAPLVAGFVGADTVGVILATGMHESDRLRLAIDIGTNGEIVLGTRERLLACSTAAGPAFEGARIRYGMRAATGAIDRVDLGDGRPRAPHDRRRAADRPLRHGPHRRRGGRWCGRASWRPAASCGRPSEVAAAAPALARRVIGADGETAFVLAAKGQTQSGHPILLTQKDVREVQLAKGAMAAGIETLLEEFGARPRDIDEVLLAGAFGNFIRPDRALAIGLLPPVPLERIRFVGNAAGAGARMLLVNRDLRRVADDVARGVEHVELSRRPDFQARFAEAMAFPAAGA